MIVDSFSSDAYERRQGTAVRPRGTAPAAVGGIVLAYLGIAVMALAVAVVLSARRFPARRPAVERWGGNLFLVGAVIWVIHYARFLIP